MKRLFLYMIRLTILLVAFPFMLTFNLIQADNASSKEGGQEYVIQADDWLSKLAEKFYGDPLAWPAIWLATNAKAVEDDSFETIDNPNSIEVGQKLWIPAVTEIGEYNKPDAPRANDTEAYNYAYQGNTLKLQGDLAGAIVKYNKALELDPTWVEIYLNRGVTRYDQSDFLGAISDYNIAIALQPTFAKAYNNRGFTFEGLGEYNRAIEDYTKALELNPNYIRAYFNRAHLYYTAFRDLEAAFADYENAAKLDPLNAEAHNGVCWCGSLLNKAATVIDNCNQAVKLAETEKDRVAFRDSRGIARALMKDFEGAKEDFEAYVDWLSANDGNKNIDDMGDRQKWISILEKNQNPFDEDVLDAIFRDDG